MEEDICKHRTLLEDDVFWKKADTRIIYETCDGKTFNNLHEAKIHDREESRKRYYEHLLKNRNWFQRFFNIKPSMEFYDRMSLKAYHHV